MHDTSGIWNSHLFRSSQKGIINNKSMSQMIHFSSVFLPGTRSIRSVWSVATRKTSSMLKKNAAFYMLFTSFISTLIETIQDLRLSQFLRTMLRCMYWKTIVWLGLSNDKYKSILKVFKIRFILNDQS